MAVSDAKLIINTLGAKEKRGATYCDGTVMSVRGNVAYVNIEGGAQRTPCQLAMAAKVGDKVKVSIIDHTASITGNYTTPATGDAEAITARRKADAAFNSAMEAYGSAQTAAAAASAATASAGRAAAAATTAENKARDAETAANNAETAANTAMGKADEAIASAYNANEYAARALGHLGTVESVAETLTWITEHGTMTKTQDAEPDPTHVYFVAAENGYYQVGTKQAYRLTEDVAIDPDKDYYKLVYSYSLTEDTEIVEGKTYYQLVEGEYVAVENPVVEDISTYYERSESYELVQNPVVEDISTYYEIVNVPARYDIVIEPDADEMGTYYELTIRESLQNYVGTHMALNDEGLWLMPEGQSGSRILISTGMGTYDAGTHIFDGVSGSPVAYYGEETVIGDPLGFHILITPNTVDGISGLIGFYYGPNRISYISSTQLVIPNAVVVESLSVGTNWMWVTSANGNLNLKWVGE